MNSISDFFINAQETVSQLTLVQKNPDIALDCRSYSETQDWLFEKKDGQWEPLRKLKGQDLEFVWEQIGKMEVSDGQKMINPLYENNNLIESINKISKHNELEKKVETSLQEISSYKFSQFVALGSFALITVGIMNSPSVEKVLLGALPLALIAIAHMKSTQSKKNLENDTLALQNHDYSLNANEQDFIKQENILRKKM